MEYILDVEPSDRIHNTNQLSIDFDKRYNQRTGYKPEGLWYSFGKQWIDWCRCEMPEWIKKYNYQIFIDSDKIIKIETEEDFTEFVKNFSVNLNQVPEKRLIDWSKVCLNYDGIEIANSQNHYNYFWKFRNYNWYNGWDIGSGCVWNLKDVFGKRLYT